MPSRFNLWMADRDDIMRQVEAKFRAQLEAAVSSVQCPIHRQPARLVDRGRARWAIEGCCDVLIELAKKELPK